MKRDYVFTPSAVTDLLQIWKHVADEDSEGAADRVIENIYKECQKIHDMPGIGHFRDDLLDRRHRFWNAGAYLIAYRWQKKPVQIIAVVHGARDLDAFFHRVP